VLVESWEDGALALEALALHAAAISELARSSLREAHFDLEKELAKPWVRSWFVRESSEACPVGFLIAWHVADELHILSVVVEPGLRRRGIGRALMRASLEYAKRHEIRLLLLEVRRSNRPAIKLYRAFSFTALGVRPNYYADTGEDAVEMMLALDPETGAVRASRDEVRIED
jgi:[ribosomal protein S18]-alanine N-acetyltransferase